MGIWRDEVLAGKDRFVETIVRKQHSLLQAGVSEQKCLKVLVDKRVLQLRAFIF
jgi:hypothetical protein